MIPGPAAKDFDIWVLTTPSGKKYKAYVIGRANGHIMDWRGCNFRCTPVSGQGRGFDTVEETKQFIKNLPEEKKKIEFQKARYSDGSFLKDERVV